MGRKGWAAIIVALVLLVAGVVAVVRLRKDADETKEVQTAVVTRGDLSRTVGGTGSLVPGEQLNVSFSSSGVVQEVLVTEGQTVGVGDPLAVLDTRSLELDAASARAQLASAQSARASASADLTALESGPTASEIEQARLDVESAKNSLWGSQAARDGICGRVERGQGQQYECDGAEASVHRGEASVRQAELQLEDLMAGATDSELAQARNKVAQAEAGVVSAQGQVEDAELLLAEATITSSISGTVTAVNVTAGERCSTDVSAIEVSDLGSLEVEISLDETDVADVQVGQSATVLLDAFPDEAITGTVQSVSVVATTSSGVVLYPVTVSLGASSAAVRPGMTADVDIVLDSVTDALIVPLKAVISGPNGVSLVLRTQTADGSTESEASQMSGPPPGAAGRQWRGTPPPFATPGAFGQRARLAQAAQGSGTPVRVEVGLTNDSYAEVLSGLHEGDVVVVQSTGTSSNSNRFPGMGGPPDEIGGMMIRVP